MLKGLGLVWSWDLCSMLVKCDINEMECVSYRILRRKSLITIIINTYLTLPSRKAVMLLKARCLFR
jgi:hypothetical protein